LLRLPVVAFFGAFLADCLDGVLAILNENKTGGKKKKNRERVYV
jgi:hypothetical protein